jgi:hypothetical protein
MFKDLSGIRVGMLTVIRRAGRDKFGSSLWLCLCDCGNTTEKVRSGTLTGGKQQSCGCLTKARMRANAKHGHCANDTQTVEYRVFRRARVRCTDPNCKDYFRYGGRGIKFLFSSFQEFINCVGRKPSPAHSLDRIDNNGNYEPGNVRWATQTDQARNRRTNHLVTIGGETKTVTEWARERGLNEFTVFTRIYDGWAPETAITTPVRTRSTTALEY